jgi:hypothetical protein
MADSVRDRCSELKVRNSVKFSDPFPQLTVGFGPLIDDTRFDSGGNSIAPRQWPLALWELAAPTANRPFLGLALGLALEFSPELGLGFGSGLAVAEARPMG